MGRTIQTGELNLNRLRVSLMCDSGVGSTINPFSQHKNISNVNVTCVALMSSPKCHKTEKKYLAPYN